MSEKSEDSEKSEKSENRVYPEFHAVTMRSGGQITLPVELRRALELKDGATFQVMGWPGEGRVLLVEKDRIGQDLARFVRQDVGFAPQPQADADEPGAS